MNIIPLLSLSDNYIWLLQENQQAVVIDPGEAMPVVDFLTARQLDLAEIWLTHAHADHVDGVATLKQQYPLCRVYGDKNWVQVDTGVFEGSRFEWFDQSVVVWHIPGHTVDHLAYVLTDDGMQQRVFCGDTLFSAGCGRVVSGMMAQMFDSLQRLNSLPETTLFYPAHEYTASNLRFAQAVEPQNWQIQQALSQVDKIPTLPVSLAHERCVNPFLRVDEPAVITKVEQEGLSHDQAARPLSVFTFLREWKNRF